MKSDAMERERDGARDRVMQVSLNGGSDGVRWRSRADR